MGSFLPGHLLRIMCVSACHSVVVGRSARIAYCGLFALSLIVAWILREVAAPLMEQIPWITHFHKTLDREWFETYAVLRVSLGNFLSFSILSLLMAGVKNQKDPLDLFSCDYKDSHGWCPEACRGILPDCHEPGVYIKTASPLFWVGNLDNVLCMGVKRATLLQFKHGLIDQAHQLLSKRNLNP